MICDSKINQKFNLYVIYAHSSVSSGSVKHSSAPFKDTVNVVSAPFNIFLDETNGNSHDYITGSLS
jgi:hypothetical protein